MSQGNYPTSPGNDPFGGTQQQDHRDYLNRFRQGPQAVTEGEAAARYEQVAPQLPPDVYQQSAQDVFAQLTPEQRMQLGQQLIQSARRGGQDFPDVNGDGIDDRLQDPDFLAQKATQVHQQQPGLLGGLLGGGAAGGGGALGGGGAGHVPGAGTTGGGATGGGLGGMLGSPMAKGILGGIAGAGLMRMLGGGGHHHYGGGGLFGGGGPMMGGYFGGGPMFGGGGYGMGGEMYEEGYEEGMEDAMGGDMGGGDFGE
jgi:hypothetical protein